MDEHLETVIARAEELAERVAVLEERSLRASRNAALQMIETNILRAEVYLDASPAAMAARIHIRESSAVR